MSLIQKGTVFQSFVSVIASLFFMVCHIKLWPYPYPGANFLKLFADLQVMLVALVGLILRIDEVTLNNEVLGRDFYGGAMYACLVLTLVPITMALVYKTPMERALEQLQKHATVDLSNDCDKNSEEFESAYKTPCDWYKAVSKREKERKLKARRSMKEDGKLIQGHKMRVELKRKLETLTVGSKDDELSADADPTLCAIVNAKESYLHPATLATKLSDSSQTEERIKEQIIDLIMLNHKAAQNANRLVAAKNVGTLAVEQHIGVSSPR